MTASGNRWWLAATLVAVLALAASANSIVNGFTYDDVYTIVRDPRAHSLSSWWTEFTGTYWSARWGADGYRPMTRIMFRIAWAIGDGSPMPFHAMNIVLHLAGSVAVFWLASALLPFAAAWIAASVYAVHPVHAEAIANSVGIAELCVLLLIVLASGLYVHGRRAGPISWRRWLAIGTLYAFACFFKEHAIVLPALLVFAELLVVPDRLTARQRLANLRLPVLLLTVVAVAFLWARTSAVRGVSGFVPAIPFQTLNLTTGNRFLTMIGASPEWFRLLLWPQRLMTDYAPPYIDMAEGLSLVQLPGALLLIGTLGLAVACWRRSPVTSFGILWIVVTLLPVSNLVVPTGVLLAERTLMLPSVGALIALCSAIPWLYARLERLRLAPAVAAALVMALIALGIGRSINRNSKWIDNETLFRQGVLDSPRSYRMHWLLGYHLLTTDRKDEGLAHLEQAFRLFPYDPIPAYMVATGLRERGRCEPAVQLYRWAFEISPSLRRYQVGLSICLAHMLRLEEAKSVALDALRYGARYRPTVDIIRGIDAGQDSLLARQARGESTILTGQSP